MKRISRDTVALAWLMLVALVLMTHGVSAFHSNNLSQSTKAVNSYLLRSDNVADALASHHAPIGQLKLLTKSSLLAKNKDINDGGSSVEEYRNAATQFLSNFMSNEAEMTNDSNNSSIDRIDFQAPKIPSTTSMETLASALDYELIQSEWFVTGKVNPSYFSDDFSFQDPDVKVNGIEDYARGVNKIFDQSTARAEIISTVVNTESENPTITVTWRLSGGVNIAWGLTIKPYIVYTDLVVDPTTSLIVFQEDRFDIPSWDIFLSIFFPFLIGKVTAPPAPPVPQRQVEMPSL